MKKKTQVIQALKTLGFTYDNAYRIVFKSKGQAAKALVSLIQDLIDRGIEIRG